MQRSSFNNPSSFTSPEYRLGKWRPQIQIRIVFQKRNVWNWGSRFQNSRKSDGNTFQSCNQVVQVRWSQRKKHCTRFCKILEFIICDEMRSSIVTNLIKWSQTLFLFFTCIYCIVIICSFFGFYFLLFAQKNESSHFSPSLHGNVFSFFKVVQIFKGFIGALAHLNAIWYPCGLHTTRHIHGVFFFFFGSKIRKIFFFTSP